jgi:hypothetical protein
MCRVVWTIARAGEIPPFAWISPPNRKSKADIEPVMRMDNIMVVIMILIGRANSVS